MNSHKLNWYWHAVSLSILALLAPASFGQIASYGGDGVLNAPYRGTINSLREMSMDVGYGEVESRVEPLFSTNTFTTTTMLIWHEVPVGYTGWDRSILRLYRGLDASGTEIDLTGHTDQASAVSLSVSIGSFERFSFRAMGTKTLAVQNFRVIFRYNIGAGTTNFTRNVKVAPITGSFNTLPGENEAFHYGTPILDVSVGNAKLVVPIGRKAEMIGAAFVDKDVVLGPSTIESSDFLFPGAAESVYIQNFNQFRLLGGGINGAQKSSYGTPWPGYLIGFYNSNHIYGGDGTRFFNHPTAISSTTGGKEIRRTQYITPFWRNQTDPPSQTYIYDGSNRIVTIQDGAGNYITLTRDGSGVVTRISTSDGRGWNIESNDPNGWITAVVPDGGKGARYYSHNTDGRVTDVRLSQTAGTNVMYQFVYDSTTNGDLREEWHYIEAEGQLRKVVEHVVVSEALRQRKEYFGTGVNDYRQYDFAYDTTASPAPLNHRLKSITSHSGPAGTGTAYTTTYAHNVGSPSDPPNSAGTMVITDVTLPDSTTIHYDYDSQYNPQMGSNPSINVGFRTKATRTGPGGSLVTLDRDYEFFYPSSVTRLFYRPRIVRERDGRYPTVNTEVVYDYENGGTDENGDGINGEEMNQLLKRTGPTIALGTSGTRTPETRYTYNNTASDPTKIGTLRHQETDFGSGQHRDVDFTYDSLLRLSTQTVDPGTPPAQKNIITTYQYVDNLPTQDRIVIDPDNYYTKTTFDNDGRLLTEQRFLNPGAASGPSYGVTNAYNTAGRLETRTVENKDQDGNSLAPATIATEFTYDRIGRFIQKVVDPTGIGQQSSFTYTWQNEIEKEYDTSLRGVKRTYDGRGLLQTEVPLNDAGAEVTALTTTYDYHATSGYLEFVTKPTGAKVQKVYDDFGRVEQELRVPGPTGGGNTITTVYEYDAANHVTRTYVDEATTPTATHLSDSTALFDEGGFNYESRQRLAFGADGGTDPVTQRKFDWAGNVTEEKSLGDTTVADRVITTGYDGANRVETVSDAEGGLTTYVRDQRGNVTEQTVRIDGSNNAVTTTVYDALSRAIQLTDPENSASGRSDRIRRYDSRGQLLRETVRDPADIPVLTRVFSYDNAGKRTRQAMLANPAGFANPVNTAVDRVTDSGYDADGRLETRTTYNNNSGAPLSTVTTYDGLGRINTVTDPSGSFVDEDYATNGLLSQRTINDGLGNRVFTLGYDGHDRIETQTALGTPSLVTTFEYDGLNRRISVTDPKGIVSKTDFDLAARRIGLIEDEAGAKERITEFAYNRLGQLITQTAHNKTSAGGALADQVTTFRYDTLGRQRRAIYPDSTNVNPSESCTDCVQSEYDDAGRMTSRTDQRGLVSTFTYDDRGLPLTRTTGTTRDTWDYDAVGRPILADRGTTGNPTATSHTVFAYTGLGDLDYEVQTIAGGTPRTIDYGEDQAGNRTSVAYPGGTVLAYVPTNLNQVDTISLNASPLVDYSYNGQRLDKRRTTTNDSLHATVYETTWGYDDHRRTNAVNNVLEVDAIPQTVAAYAFTHDNNGNLLTQMASGSGTFAADDRTFTVDRLNRLTQTDYAESGTSESSILDLVGNRESHTDRAGGTSSYTLANAANEYASINAQPVIYDAAGNLTTDEAGRTYQYDERNRLIEVRDGVSNLLASYSYDALGRRVTATIGGVVTRYYYDGQNVIEERDGSDVRVRYHVNGTQFIDERVATYNDSSGQFTYYLLKDNFSVAGTANADGSTITRSDYSSTGDFAGAGGGINVDYDPDGDVDGADFSLFDACFSGPNVPQNTPSCADKKLDSDNDVDQDDFGIFQECFSGAGNAAAAECTGQAGGVTNGDFALHGRPVDVLTDGHALLYVRARYYDLKNGRWIQRDPRPYNDGPNLYEAFRANPLGYVDPSGEGIITWILVGDYGYSDADFIRIGGLQAAARGFGEGAVRASKNVAIGAGKTVTEVGFVFHDGAVLVVDIPATYLGHPLDIDLRSQIGKASERTDDPLGLTAQVAKEAGANILTLGTYNVVVQTIEYAETGDADTFSQNVGGPSVVILATVGAGRVTGPAQVTLGRTATVERAGTSGLIHRGTIGESPLIGARVIQAELKASALAKGGAPAAATEGAPTGAISGPRLFRFVTEGELEAILATGLLRAGRPGETFFTTQEIKSALRAQRRLALPRPPTHRIEFEILNEPDIIGPGRVVPKFGQPGQGIELFTRDLIQPRIINVQPLRP